MTKLWIFYKNPITRKVLASVYISPIGSSRPDFRRCIAAEILRYKRLMSGMHLSARMTPGGMHVFQPVEAMN